MLTNNLSQSVLNSFSLKDKVAIITGGAGLLGQKHAEAIAEFGGIPILIDLNHEAASKCSKAISSTYKVKSISLNIDITNKDQLSNCCEKILSDFGSIDILINNAANNPKVEKSDSSSIEWERFEDFSLDTWQKDINVGLTGAFLCSQVFGLAMIKQKKGVILNIASELSIIAPDQRIYKNPSLEENQQPVKPVTYSVVKSGLVGLTKYLATYWSDQGIRVNALSPAAVSNNQDPEFVKKLSNLIPLGRMSQPDEFKSAIVFLVSDASSFMTGTNVVMDGGRTCW